MNKILFLDTETSSLSPLNGQIIEIAGVLVSFDKNTLKFEVLSEFSELVKPFHEIDEKITNLTGITQEELDLSKSQKNVQSSWYNWLSQGVDLIVGHSIDFDLGFLKHEGWFIPENSKFTDTLDLSKLLLTTQPAINLEFLIAALNLNKYIHRLYPDYKNQQKAHRALYDSQNCLALFVYLVELLAKLPLPVELFNLIKTKLLKLDIITYSSDHIIFKSQKNKDLDLQINLSGEVSEISNDNKVRLLAYQFKDGVPSDYWNILSKLNTNLFKTAASLVISVFWNYLGYTGAYYLHTYTQDERFLLQELVNYFAPTQSSIINSYTLENIENIISKIDNIQSKQLNLSLLSSSLDVLNILTVQEKTREICQKAISAISFLQIFLEIKLSHGTYTYVPQDIDAYSNTTQAKLKEVNQYLQYIKNISPPDGTFEKHILTKIQSQIWNITVTENHIFKEFNKQLILLKTQTKNLSEHFISIVSKYPKLNTSTYLLEDDYKALCKIVNINLPIPVSYLTETKNTVSQPLNDIHLIDLYTEEINKAKTQDGIVIILTNKNSQIIENYKILNEHCNYEDYLVVGESGSLQKIVSKIKLGFKGLVIIKSKDFEYLFQHINTMIVTVYTLNKPFIYLPDNLSNSLGHQEKNTLLRLYQESVLSKIFYYYKQEIKWINSYSIK